MLQPFHKALANEAESVIIEPVPVAADVQEQNVNSTPEIIVEQPKEIIENSEVDEQTVKEVTVESKDETPLTINIETSDPETEQSNVSTNSVVSTPIPTLGTTSVAVPVIIVSSTTDNVGATDITVQATETSDEEGGNAAKATSTETTDLVVVLIASTTITNDNPTTTTTTIDSVINGLSTTTTTTTEPLGPDNTKSETIDVEFSDANGGSDSDAGQDSQPFNKSSSTDDLIDTEAIGRDVAGLVDNVVNEVVTMTRQLVTEENFYQFSRQSCMAVGDGTYHCTTKEPNSIDPDSAIYAEQDVNGDMEIYLRTSKGDIKQLTDNEYDDTSPDVDLSTMRAVWQRLIDGRYQIISYDLVKREETQLTFSKNNSMEPKVSKDGMVWQAWDGNDWEVMYFDGQYTEQVTSNEIQDVTPVIEDGYILWSILGGKQSEARVYSLESKEIMNITGHDGGTVANPRFVLIYDTKFDNGDVVTVGFDPVTGLAQPVAAKPVDLPFDIPEPDPVGEIRALIQNKSANKGTDVVTVPVDSGNNDLNLASSTATSTDTLNLHNQNDLDQEFDMPTTTTEFLTFELEENDLVITKEASSTTARLNQIYYETLATSTATSTQE